LKHEADPQSTGKEPSLFAEVDPFDDTSEEEPSDE